MPESPCDRNATPDNEFVKLCAVPNEQLWRSGNATINSNAIHTLAHIVSGFESLPVVPKDWSGSFAPPERILIE